MGLENSVARRPKAGTAEVHGNDMRILEEQQYFSAANAMNIIGIYRCAIISLKDDFGK